MGELVRVFFISQKQIVAVGKSNHDNKRTTNSASSTTTSTERRAHRTAHLTAAGKPTASIYFNAFRRMRLTHSTVVSKAYVKNVGKLSEVTAPAR